MFQKLYKILKQFINYSLEFLDLKIIRKSLFNKLIEDEAIYRDYKLLNFINKNHLNNYLEHLPFSNSQLKQDLFVLNELGFKKEGFFVEFGATNGTDLSNTLLLEKKFQWSGILAEPAKVWHEKLFINRTASIETDCVWKSSNEKLLFNEANDQKHGGELSTIDYFSNSDLHQSSRKGGNKYYVNTISLKDLLIKHKAPSIIDYLSIDTEGSEFEILNAFDFESYDIKIITCEHNYSPNREKIYDLLIRNGYKRKFTNISMFDDWYVRV